MNETLTAKQAQQVVSEMTPEARSEQALALLNNPMFVATLADMENAECEALFNSSADNSEFREVHYFKVQCIRTLRSDLSAVWRNIQRPTANSAKKSAEKVLQRG